MSKVLKDVYNAERFRTLGHQLIDALADHYEGIIEGKAEQVIPWKEPEEMLQFWRSKDLQAMDLAQLFRTILAQSTAIHHPRFIGHQVGMSAPVSTLFGLLSSHLNNGTAVYEMGMVSNVLETMIVEELCQRLEWGASSGGVFTSGGTLANLTALLTVRNVRKSQVRAGFQPAVMVSEQAHYCIERAAMIMGWPSKAVIQIPVDERFCMRTDLLEEHCQQALEDGLDVQAVIGCACSTSTGSYDDLLAIGEFCQSRKLWFHVDAAHGGAALFSPEYRSLLHGIEQADSVILDFHKLLMTPALATALLYKDNHHSFQTFQQEADYLLDLEPDWYNSGKRTFECTKYMMGVKVYSIVHAHGWGAFGENVTTLYNKARRFADKVKAESNLILVGVVQSNILCFRIARDALSREELNALNEAVRRRVVERGRFYIVQTVLHGYVCLRLTVMNPFTSDEDFDSLLEEIKHHSRL